jgi:hypothetical protein
MTTMTTTTQRWRMIAVNVAACVDAGAVLVNAVGCNVFVVGGVMRA